MNIFQKIIRKLFLVKEITSKEGIVHFRRYRLLSLPWLRIYVHHILVSDYEDHFHTHPWHFESHILYGSYSEKWTKHPLHDQVINNKYSAGDAVQHNAKDAHQLTLISPEVWTFVITWGRPETWGYHTQQGFIEHQIYRQLKNEGRLR